MAIPAQGRECLKVAGQSQAGSIFGKVDHFEEGVCCSLYNTGASAILNSGKAPTLCMASASSPGPAPQNTFPRASRAHGSRRTNGGPCGTVASLGHETDQRVCIRIPLSCLV